MTAILNREGLLKTAPIVDMLDFKDTFNGMSYGLSEAGYDIRIKQAIDFKAGPVPRVIVHHDHKTEYKEGRFCLASAIEKFDMPNTLIGQVFDKSSWARHGLSLFNTVIEPGWKGFLTLELVFHGNEDIFIPAGSPIAQVIFSPVSTPVAYTGKYQNQDDRPIPAIEA